MSPALWIPPTLTPIAPLWAVTEQDAELPVSHCNFSRAVCFTRDNGFHCGVGKDSWESLGLHGDQTCNTKGNQSWIFIGRTDAEALILWPPDAKSWLTRKDPDAGKDWGQEEKEETEDEMVGWHHRLSRHGCEQTLGDGEGQGSLGAAVHEVAKRRALLSEWTKQQQCVCSSATLSICLNL